MESIGRVEIVVSRWGKSKNLCSILLPERVVAKALSALSKRPPKLEDLLAEDIKKEDAPTGYVSPETSILEKEDKKRAEERIEEPPILESVRRGDTPGHYSALKSYWFETESENEGLVTAKWELPYIKTIEQLINSLLGWPTHTNAHMMPWEHPKYRWPIMHHETWVLFYYQREIRTFEAQTIAHYMKADYFNGEAEAL